MATILMIDDDADFSGLASVHFTKLGYTVALAQNGKEGLAKAIALKPDLIFLDIVMPEMNGIEVLRELQAADETADVPVIVMSGKYFDSGMIEIFTQERNCRAFLGKPVALAQLQEKVEALLKK
ncbi:MAG: response regulator [Elusimicrobiota bacterium]|nr:response regulator [Elusimicrobiota bacterium]